MLILKDIVKDYYVQDNKPTHALKGVSLEFGDTGFVCILGPSGCGKTTLLNIIGGLDKYTSGDVIINGQSTKNYTDMDWDAYRNREIGIVFQTYNLIMHLSVLGNVELAMTLSGVPAKEREERAKETLISVGLESEINKKPNQLSGGQMQRVAIARALINKPNIILADEPTGALDSKTSVQVMDILRDISQKKLVIVVTHNEELAKQYATRIIRVFDGLVVSDSANPDRVAAEKEIDARARQETAAPVKAKHTSMSFQTALGISGRNLATKKGKTIITAVAASFGIIGVGFVLALSNGFSNYVNRMESETLSKFPVSVERYGYDYVNSSDTHLDSYPTDSTVHVIEPTSSRLHVNNIKKDYVDYLNTINTADKTYCSIRYNFSIGMHVIGEYDDNGTTVYSSINTSQESYLESLTSLVGGGSSAWQQLPASKDLVLSEYDLLAGEYPDESTLATDASGNPDQKDFGLVLVVNSKNALTTTVMEELGLNPNTGDYSFSDLLGKEFKYIQQDDYYGDSFINEDKDGKPIYTPGFYFKDSVKMNDIVNLVSSSSSSSSSSTKSALTSLADLIQMPTSDEMQAAFKETAVTTAMAELTPYVDADKFQSLVSKMQNGTDSVTADEIRACFTAAVASDETARTNAANALYDVMIALRSSDAIGHYFNKNLTYYKSPSSDQDKLSALYSNTNDRSLKIKAIVREKKTTSIGILSPGIYYPSSLTYQSFSDNAGSAIAKDFRNHILIEPNSTVKFNEKFKDVLDNLFSSDTTVSGDTGQILSPLVSNGSFALSTMGIVDNLKPYSSGLSSYMNARLELGTDVTFESGADLLNPLTYAEFVTTITIYPTDYDAKLYVVEKLKAYNTDKAEADQIVYTDVGQTATDIVGQIVQVISAVLIAFASISLVVSSVMIGIIIYSSVVERTKEIGILRSIGARKKDVGRLFKAEAVIIGFMSGVIGVVMTYIISVPISLTMDHQFPQNQLGMIALLNPLHAVLLILISMILTYIASLIPSRIAAKKDPVTCLRTE